MSSSKKSFESKVIPNSSFLLSNMMVLWSILAHTLLFPGYSIQRFALFIFK